MEGVSQPRLRRAQASPETAHRVRWPQPVRPVTREEPRSRVLRHRQALMSDFARHRQAVQTTRVLVVGDVMLDRYWFGDVERISPEAPVPVVKIARSEERPGGAANVARNIAALGARAMLLSATGRDEAADTLLRLLDGDRIHVSFLRDDALKTTVKLR